MIWCYILKAIWDGAFWLYIRLGYPPCVFEALGSGLDLQVWYCESFGPLGVELRFYHVILWWYRVKLCWYHVMRIVRFTQCFCGPMNPFSTLPGGPLDLSVDLCSCRTIAVAGHLPRTPRWCSIGAPRSSALCSNGTFCHADILIPFMAITHLLSQQKEGTLTVSTL